MAQTFNNGESNASIRTKLNANAEEINEIVEETIPTLVPQTRTVAGKALSANITLAKGDVGLGSVDNTADTAKPISTATQQALNAKADTTALPTKASLGLANVDNTADASKPVSTAQAAAINERVPNTRTVNGKALSADISITKTDVGLGQVENYSAINMPLSAAAENALTLKADLVTGTVPSIQLPLVDIFQNIVDAFEPGQIEIGLTGKIRIISVTPVDQLATPVLTFGTSTSDQNIINWTRPTNGVSSELDWFNETVWVNLYTGTALTFNHTGLTAETSYLYRVKAVADGFIDSNYAQSSKSTAPESGGSNLIPDYITQDVNTQTEPGREYDESPAGVFTPMSELTDNPFRTGYKMVVGSRIALKAGSLNCLYGLCESADSLFDEKRVFVGFDPSGVAFYGRKSTSNVTLSTQPTVDGFVVLTATSGQLFNISVYESGTYTSIADVDMGYNLLSFGGTICGTANSGSTSVIMYPQGKDIELV